ncbi:2-oxoglutarate dehydrogenase E1 component [Varunaivibrio sulfuroxidans]|uniref:2-oxoglutarate dehydrogenase E1 component n=1 Tax=Varunaivibrio sulfuroxidans TaxID=1773489 RepID=A0A4R3JFY0_9PROT|nr:2-oxoglutarate dehydrogenase E1 component [Varunaivibrio sulfuroxidans]TCS63600.1 2-oxoglutarate dehydrogenase E1 component [Varunaivibrio sulfuroxidans]WES30259.1 2-oxoglutarate dehydrogenase E1 component [Varunaivibrio sulfuroxidans]
MATSIDTFLNGTNAAFVAELYTRYLKDPDSIDSSWKTYFEALGDNEKAVFDDLVGASWAPRETGVVGRYARPVGNTLSDAYATHDELSTHAGQGGGELANRPSVGAVRRATLDSIRALMMIRSYRVRGHLIARFDPLGLEGNTEHAELDYRHYGFADSDLDRPIFINSVLGLETATLREILQILKETYCGSIGVEYMHIMEPDVKSWIQSRIEGIRNQTSFTVRGKRAILERLVEAEGFESFLQVKYTGTKRFGLDGGEATVPALEQIIKRGSQLGMKEIVFGMPHRGRLNVLANVLRKPYQAIISEFQGNSVLPDEVLGSGDVKYHLGTSADRVFDGANIHLSLAANPSHLEAVNTVVLGKVRSKQKLHDDRKREQVMGILLHGDAAFAGQGPVAETLDLSQLKGYRTGGTIHFIVNNQIGFTTAPRYSRSSPYPSDVAKMIQAPIFHVNGDDPEAVVHVSRIAVEFRQEFHRDVVIDMFCYRRHGHNEGDEPMFTQPIMYKTIAGHPTTRQLYAQKLISEGILSQHDADQLVQDFHAHLEREFAAADTYRPNKVDWLEGEWKGLAQLSGEEELRDDDTSVSMELLEEVGRAISTPPDNFALNSKIARQLKNKRKMIDTQEGVDWATAEALAFGTLLVEGAMVRLSGQDSGRGTFSQRHSVLVDQENEERYVPLNNIRRDQAEFEVIDSPLSEAGVLGFEYGYSLTDPHALVIWEAQFGDFANGAQVIIDQFIVSGETKWLRMSGVVMLLPHGFEGQGPEHSSARLERYLQLCAENNIQVVNCTTPAQYFHVLRRQVRRNYRKPLVVMAPKSLLRHKLVVSNLGQMGPRTRFRRVLPEADQLVLDKNVRRVVLCSGKVYYDLLAARRERKIDDVALVRLEQIYPFPWKGMQQQLSRYPNAEVVWCQEEPANMGAWTFVAQRIETILREIEHTSAKPFYIGRRGAASPAVGLLKRHQEEQAWVVDQALEGNLKDIVQPHQRPNY